MIAPKTLFQLLLNIVHVPMFRLLSTVPPPILEKSKEIVALYEEGNDNSSSGSEQVDPDVKLLESLLWLVWRTQMLYTTYPVILMLWGHHFVPIASDTFQDKILQFPVPNLFIYTFMLGVDKQRCS